jgi:hypothetical protein
MMTERTEVEVTVPPMFLGYSDCHDWIQALLRPGPSQMQLPLVKKTSDDIVFWK